jgi:hypothetical protein
VLLDAFYSAGGGVASRGVREEKQRRSVRCSLTLDGYRKWGRESKEAALK